MASLAKPLAPEQFSGPLEECIIVSTNVIWSLCRAMKDKKLLFLYIYILAWFTSTFNVGFNFNSTSYHLVTRRTMVIPTNLTSFQNGTVELLACWWEWSNHSQACYNFQMILETQKNLILHFRYCKLSLLYSIVLKHTHSNTLSKPTTVLQTHEEFNYKPQMRYL